MITIAQRKSLITAITDLIMKNEDNLCAFKKGFAELKFGKNSKAEFPKIMGEQDEKIKSVVDMKNSTERMFKELRQENDQKISEMDEKMSNKAESMLYTLKKIRGDAIISH